MSALDLPFDGRGDDRGVEAGPNGLGRDVMGHEIVDRWLDEIPVGCDRSVSWLELTFQKK